MTIELCWRERHVGATQTPRRFLDFVVNGDSLYDLLGRDSVTPLGWGTMEHQRAAVLQLLGDEAPPVEDRVSIYVCPECGDLYCGAITTIVESDGETVRWWDVANTMMDFMSGSWHHDPEPFENWPELRFDREEYRRILLEALPERR